jgi:hypothetical protein
MRCRAVLYYGHYGHYGHTVFIGAVAVLLATAVWAAPARDGSDSGDRDGRIVSIGGPDQFGYAFADSTETECALAFTDITASGTELTLSDGDDGGVLVHLPTPFAFYGASYDTLVISSNGYVAFAAGLDGDDGSDFSNDAVPAIPDTAVATVARILAVHDDLEAGATGSAWFLHTDPCPRPSETVGTEPCSIVQWSSWSFHDGGSVGDVQVVLYHSSREVVVQVQPASSLGDSATIGVQGPSGAAGLAYAVNTPGSIPSDHAVCFFHPAAPLERTDLAVSLEDKTDTVVPGGELGYVIEVANRYGPSAVAGASVSATFPGDLSCSWSCLGDPGAVCSPSGTGSISDTADIPLGASLTYEVSCTLDLAASGAVVTQAEVTRSGWTDPDPTDNTVSDTNAILALDLGSAPSPYPTTIAENGARHGIDGTLHLGSGGTADDGVVFLDAPDPGTTARVQVTASSIGRLDAWIDLNRDGDWTDPDEQIATNVVLDAGANELAVAIPLTAVPGSTWARFRISQLGGLAPTGVADHGEVEDHSITTVPVTLQSFQVQ